MTIDDKVRLDPDVDDLSFQPDQPKDREQTLADMEAKGQLADDPGESDHDDSEEKKPRIDMEDYARKGWSDVDEAINIYGRFDGFSEKGGSININILLHMTVEPSAELSARLTDVVQEVAFSAKYVGRDLGLGITVDSFTVKGAADGKEMKVVLRVPETQKMKLKNIVGYARSMGVMALVPEQLALDLPDLTARAT